MMFRYVSSAHSLSRHCSVYDTLDSIRTSHLWANKLRSDRPFFRISNTEINFLLFFEYAKLKVSIRTCVVPTETINLSPQSH